jgi:hypothetical protein
MQAADGKEKRGIEMGNRGGALTGRSDAIRVSEKEEELVWGF